MQVRFVVKYRHCDELLELKITDDKVVSAFQSCLMTYFSPLCFSIYQ